MLPRPETDYERWLRQQDPKFEPGHLPLYNEDEEVVDSRKNCQENIRCFHDIGDRSWHYLQDQGSSYGSFIEPYSALSDISHIHAILCLIILAYILAFSTALAFGKRQGREQGLSRLA
ncbi:hypothetical protein NYO67_4609 [Aspergillus flavus]|nr:hypothetical protein NYO67_4609 [Aspergillus flavus]